jgi:hypothetical protein
MAPPWKNSGTLSSYTCLYFSVGLFRSEYWGWVCWWHMSVVSATQEAEISNITI